MTQEAPGQVHLENGDSREIDSLWTAMAGKRKPTAIITSPPYGNLKDYGCMELTLVDARTFGVGFAPEQPIEAEPVLGFPAQSDADLYRITLRLIEI